MSRTGKNLSLSSVVIAMTLAGSVAALIFSGLGWLTRSKAIEIPESVQMAPAAPTPLKDNPLIDQWTKLPPR